MKQKHHKLSIQKQQINEIKLSQQQKYHSKILINADDYGYCWQRCMGIVELIKNRKIKSTSVIINAENIVQKCQKLIQTINQVYESQKWKENVGKNKRGECIQIFDCQNKNSQDISIGLHLNITQFFPCSEYQQNQIPIIDKKTKLFKGKKYIYDNLNIFSTNPSLILFIKLQIRSQIQKFIKIFKRKPSHIDGHNHIHIIPQIAQQICKIAKLYGIYKIRLPIPYKLQNTQNSIVNSYNQLFIKLAKQSKNIYDKYGFLYPNYMLGLDTIGQQFTVQQIQRKILQIQQSIPINKIQNNIIQIMIHPGYKQQQNFKQYPTCLFSKSKQRQYQLQILKSQQFTKIINDKLVSYNNIKNIKISQKSVLIYSKLVQGCGNLTTSLRLGKIFQQQLKYKVYYIDQPTIQQQNQIQRLQKMIQQLCIKLIIGVNLTRTSWIIYQAINKINNKINFTYKIPYILVIAGTDANLTLKLQQVNNNNNKLQQINIGIKNCQCLISISQQMKNKISKYLSNVKIQKDIIVIVQSTLNLLYKQCQQKCKYKNQNITKKISMNKNIKQQDKKYIIFPTSFRNVKAVHHILKQLNFLIQKYNINVYILGPIINKQYYQNTIKNLGKIQYLGCIPHQNYLNLLRKAFVMINTSQSQGMSCSILQAFVQKVPVIARKNQGNCQLVIDGKNGFIYSTGEQFISKFQYIFNNQAEVKKICQEAYIKIKENYSFQKQVKQYKELINKYYQPMIYKLNLLQIFNSQPNFESQSQKQLTFLSIKNVHSISPINLKIFSKFFIKDISGSSASDVYIKNIINSHQQNEYLNILDICCGNGIFGIYFIINLAKWLQNSQKTIKIKLYFSDIDLNCLSNLKINLKTLQHFLQSSHNKNIIIQEIFIIKSNMFEEIKKQKQNKFDIILGNLPQFPFTNAETRLDKNGGNDGIKLMRILIQNYRNYLRNKQSFLIILYSYIGDPNKYKQLLSNNNSKIDWKGQAEIHQAFRKDLDKMQIGTSTKLQQRMREGKSQITMKQQFFYIPADLRIIRPK